MERTMFSLFGTFLRVFVIAPRPKMKRSRHRAAFGEQLEARTLLSGNPVANADTYYSVQNGTLNIPGYAGVLSNGNRSRPGVAGA
jgi:hypothetical protein